ncbi:MAG: isochorismatase family protein [Desulfobulbaceae bacterium]|nr:isochorismatase family protein [Desulfobulbaceae bacterium]
MLSKEGTGLIVIDIQGNLAHLVHESSTVIANCEKLIKGATILGLPIVWLEQIPAKLGPTVKSISRLLAGNIPIPKFTFDACAEPRFMQAIGEADKTSWLVCGIEAHICVYQTTLHLKQLNYDVELVCDCIASRNPKNKELAIRKLLSAGVTITGVEMCLYELVQDCRADEFKGILKLIK